MKREPSINSGGVEKVVWDVESGVKIACRDGKFPFGQGAAGICQRVVKVEVNENKVGIGEKGKNLFRQYGAIGGTICAKEVHRGESEGAVG